MSKRKAEVRLKEVIYTTVEVDIPDGMDIDDIDEAFVLDKKNNPEETVCDGAGAEILDVKQLFQMKKVVSYVGENEKRRKRVTEVDGWDYHFISPEKILDLKANDKLLQFITFNDTHYGYPYSEFDGIDELIVVCGGSGTGKDTLLKQLANDYYFNKRIGFLFSIPETITLFTDYADKIGIKSSVFYFEVEENTRLARIIKGDIFDNRDKIDAELYRKSEVEVKVESDKFGFYVDIYIKGEFLVRNAVVKDIINQAKKRVLRDRESSFRVGIDKVKAENDFEVIEFDFSNDTISDAVTSLALKLQ